MKNYKWILLIINLFSVSCLSSVVHLNDEEHHKSVKYIPPYKPSNLSFNKLMNEMNIGKETIIKGYTVHGIDGFLASLQGVGSETYANLKGLKPYMPFHKWIIVTNDNKDILSLPSEITADGKYVIQFAYFFPKAFEKNDSPKRLVISSNIEDKYISKKWIQNFIPFEEDLIQLDIKFHNLNRIIHHKSPNKEDMKFFADYGIVSLQYKYAFACYKGLWGLPKLFESRHYFKLAANQDLVEAQFYYALMCYEGMGGLQDLKNASHYFKLAAEQGLKEAQFNYADICYRGENGPRQLKIARHYHKRAADQGLKEAQFYYAIMCQNDEGGQKDVGESKKYFKLAADQGFVKAQRAYALICEKNGHLDEAMKYYKSAADQGDIISQYNLANMYYYAKGNLKNLALARYYFSKAALQGHIKALQNFSHMCIQDEGAPVI